MNFRQLDTEKKLLLLASLLNLVAVTLASLSTVLAATESGTLRADFKPITNTPAQETPRARDYFR